MMSVIPNAEAAPDFELSADGDSKIRLSDLKGRKVVLYFYPKDDTKSCTAEAIDFSASQAAFDSAGAAVIGISPDSVQSHDKFKAKYDLSIRLASDEAREVLEAYGVWQEKSMYGKKYMGVARTTYLIDANGKVARVWENVRVKGHVAEVLAAAQAL